MPRQRLASRLTLWAFAGALLLKSAVPMLASAAAGLQGKPLAEVCDVYGVDMSAIAVQPLAAPAMVAPTDAMSMAPAESASHHHHQHMHGAAMADAVAMAPMHDEGVGAPAPPASHDHPGGHGSSHGSDHCALTGMVLAGAAAAPMLAALPSQGAVATVASRPAALAFDAAARWAARMGHAPPVFS